MKTFEQFMRGIFGAAKAMWLPAPVLSGRVGANGESTSDKPALYQVWHDHNWPGSHIRHVIGLGPEPPFPQSYTHVANVWATSWEQVFELTKDKGSMVDGPGNWQPWEKNPGVEVLVMARRSTSTGDVIIDPQGMEYRVKQEGFNYVEASRERYTLFEILAVMEKARG